MMLVMPKVTVAQVQIVVCGRGRKKHIHIKNRDGAHSSSLYFVSILCNSKIIYYLSVIEDYRNIFIVLRIYYDSGLFKVEEDN